MIKIGYKIDLSVLSFEELMLLKKIKILTKSDIEKEMAERGVSSHKTLLKIRDFKK